jgi:hypothetical protein
MTWSAPKTWVSGDVLPADELNTYLRDNQLGMAPSLAQTSTAYFATVDQNEIAERIPTSDYISTMETQTSTTYGDLATVGPTVTVDLTSAALVLFSTYCYVRIDDGEPDWANGDACFTSVNVTGANVIPADDTRAILLQGTGGQISCSATMFQNLNPGITTFTVQYKLHLSTAPPPGRTAMYSARRIAVLPF